jgi:hypothetical protein
MLMQVIMLVQAMMQVMGDGDVRDNNIFKTLFSSKKYHLLCWIFSKSLSGKLG